MLRSPCARASPHAASTCSCDSVGTPPSRMLADAKILIRSAPSPFEPADLLADLIGRPLRVRDLPERRQDARARQHAAIDRIAQHLVRRRADALHGREAGHQRDVGILGAVERGLLGGLRPAVIAALVVEVPADVDVRVDEAGQQREVAEIDRRRRRSTAPTLTILPSLTMTVALVVGAATAIDHLPRLDGRGVRLRTGDRRGRGQKCGHEDASHDADYAPTA